MTVYVGKGMCRPPKRDERPTGNLSLGPLPVQGRRGLAARLGLSEEAKPRLVTRALPADAGAQIPTTTRRGQEGWSCRLRRMAVRLERCSLPRPFRPCVSG